MVLTNDQITSLMSLISTTESDDLDCDGCFGNIAEFAERELTNQDVPDALKSVETHLKQCTCCKDEYSALLEGLRALDESN